VQNFVDRHIHHTPEVSIRQDVRDNDNSYAMLTEFRSRGMIVSLPNQLVGVPLNRQPHVRIEIVNNQFQVVINDGTNEIRYLVMDNLNGE
jgi:hypothetical protein